MQKPHDIKALLIGSILIGYVLFIAALAVLSAHYAQRIRQSPVMPVNGINR
jgi:hypothetical protein